MKKLILLVLLSVFTTILLAQKIIHTNVVIEDSLRVEKTTLLKGDITTQGSATIGTIANGTGDFVTAPTGGGLLKLRTAAQVLSDIGAVIGSGVDGYIPNWNGAGNVLEDSPIYTGGTNVGINTQTGLSMLSINGGLHVGGDSDAGDNNLLVDGTATITTIANGTGDFVTAPTGGGLLKLRTAAQMAVDIGAVSGNGINSYIPNWNGTGSVLEDSPIFVNGDDIGIGTTIPGAKLGLSIPGGYNERILSFMEIDNEVFYFDGKFAGSGITGNWLELNTYWGYNAMTWRADGSVGIGVTLPDRKIHIEESTALTNTIQQIARLSHITSEIPANNIGLGIEFEQETSADNNEVIATIEAIVTDATLASEDGSLSLKIMTAGGAATEKLNITPTSITLASGVDLVVTNGDVEATGYITGTKCGVFAYLIASDTNVCSSADTWYPLQGVFTNSPMEQFSFVTDHIEYDGTLTQYFEIDWHAAGSASANGTTVHIGVKKNGSIVTSSVMGTFLKIANEKQSLSGTCVVELATNDEIQIVIKADGAGDIITNNQFTTTVTEFFD